MKRYLCLLAFLIACHTAERAVDTDPLPSWNDTASKQAIVEYVTKVTSEGGPDFVPPAERIATFDNDGTLWAEQPLYFQLLFAFDRIKAMAPQHPEWETQEPFASLLKGDMAGALAGGEKGLVDILEATHAGMTTVEFEQTVNDWLANAKHRRRRSGIPRWPISHARAARVLAGARLQDFTCRAAVSSSCAWRKGLRILPSRWWGAAAS